MSDDHANEIHVEMDEADIARAVARGIIRPVIDNGRTVYEIVDIKGLLGVSDDR